MSGKKLPAWVTKWQTVIGLILAVTALVSMCWGSVRTIDTRYQKVTASFEVNTKQWEEIRLVSQRLNQKILSDRINDYKRRIWDLEDRNGCHTVPECESKMDDVTRDLYRKMVKDRAEAQEQYDRIDIP